MWATSENILSSQIIEDLLCRADYLISAKTGDKNVFVDKNFFSNNGEESRNLDILSAIHKSVWSKISGQLSY